MNVCAPKGNKRGTRPQSFLLSKAARGFDHDAPFFSNEDKAYEEFKRLAFENGHPTCPKCRHSACYELRCRRVFKCRGCGKQFSAKKGTIFERSKLPYTKILRAISIFGTAASGYPALQVSLKINVQYKTAWRLLRKLRGAMARDFDPAPLSDDVEIDGTEFGGYLRPKNSRKRASKVDQTKVVKNLWKMPKGKNKLVCVVVRERTGRRRCRTTIVKSEGGAKDFILSLLGSDATLHADTGTEFNDLVRCLKKRFKRTNHSDAFWTPASHTNNAENFFSVFKWTAQAIYKHFSKNEDHAALYAEETAWRLTYNRSSEADRFGRLVRAVAARAPGLGVVPTAFGHV